MPGKGVRERSESHRIGQEGGRQGGQKRRNSRREEELEGSQTWEKTRLLGSVQETETEQPENHPS